MENENRLFKPERTERHEDVPMAVRGAGADRRDGRIYIYHADKIALAVNVALATRRPLLVSGPSGCGKSSLALNVALTLGRRYYEYVVSARSEARDLLWSLDNLRRLNDAQMKEKEIGSTASYIDPGVLWWAFDPEDAKQRGSRDELVAEEAKDPNPIEQKGEGAVVLIDEIDKADPDLPNDLLVPLGSLQFFVPPVQHTVRCDKAPLVFITTNGERELPNAFLRRCVSLQMGALSEEMLLEVAEASFPLEKHDKRLFKKIASFVVNQSVETSGRSAQPSTAEFLDLVRACIEIGVDADDPEFIELAEMTLVRKADFL